MTWEKVENAIARAVRIASGLSESQVLWDYHDGARPTDKPFIAMHIASDQLTSDRPEVSQVYDSTRGKIVATYLYNRELLVRLVAYGKANAGAYSTRAVLAETQNALSNESVKRHLDEAGLALIDRGNISAAPVLFDSSWENRSIVELRFRLRDFSQEALDYVASVGTSGTYT
jgi:hypothetical protein